METPLCQSKMRWLAALALVALLAGVALSRCIEPGVRVQSVILAGDTPALQFLPTREGTHPVALLAHGITASKETLFRYGEALAAAGFICFSIDLPGHGESPKRFTTSFTETVRTVEEVAHGLGHVDVFIGHSMGAGAGAAAISDAGLNPSLFIAIGALPAPFEHGPPLLLLAGRWDELLPMDALKARTDAHLIISACSDHALEPFDPLLVNAAVGAACEAVGQTPPPAPTRWLWRLTGFVLAVLGAFGLALVLPQLSSRLAQFRGLILSGFIILACIFTANTWLGVELHLRRLPLLLVTMLISLMAVLGASKLRIPRWSFPAFAGALAIGCLILRTFMRSSTPAAPLLSLAAFMFALLALVLLAGTGLGRIAAHRGSRVDGNLAMAIFVGLVIGQWMPRIF
jgi:pimeloyl-ACP methyl ester carboxylesterase